MRNRAKRNKWLMRQPVTHAFQLLLARQRTACTARVQLVLASATLSKRTMRDMSTIVRPRLHSRAEPGPALSPALTPSRSAAHLSDRDLRLTLTLTLTLALTR